jgi:PilZ domain-containing protein
MRERRQVPRYQYRARGRLIVSSAVQSPIEVDFTTLSVRGCRVQGKSVPSVGKRCQVALQWEGLEFRGEAEVKWKKPNGEAGLVFTSVDETNLTLIRRLCANLHMEPLAPPSPEPEDEAE